MPYQASMWRVVFLGGVGGGMKVGEGAGCRLRGGGEGGLEGGGVDVMGRGRTSVHVEAKRLGRDG